MTYRKAPLPLACIAASLLAQACVQYVPEGGYPPPPPPPPYSAPSAAAAPAQDYREVDALMAPIALYPDPLIAILLPASTLPSEITAASAYLVQYGDMARIDSQPWDPSVRALAHYPTVVAWMAQNIEWTEAVGSEFSSSPSEAMDSIQRLRARAWAAGTLSSTPQQQVYSDDGAIDILPAQADELYVPAYDPDVMYPDEPYYGFNGPFMYFGSPFPAGIWLDYAFDWHRHRVWSGCRDGWRDHGGWRAPRFDAGQAPAGARSWHPRPGHTGPGRGARATAVPVPRSMPGAPKPPASRVRSAIPRPAQPAPGISKGQPAPEGAAPRDRPRLGVQPASEGPARQAGSAPGNGAARPTGTEARGSAPTRPAPPPAPGSREMRAPAPARTSAAPSAAHSAPAPAAAPAPSSSSSGNNQPQK
jgi:hypothetical protein